MVNEGKPYLVDVKRGLVVKAVVDRDEKDLVG